MDRIIFINNLNVNWPKTCYLPMIIPGDYLAEIDDDDDTHTHYIYIYIYIYIEIKEADITHYSVRCLLDVLRLVSLWPKW